MDWDPAGDYQKTLIGHTVCPAFLDQSAEGLVMELSTAALRKFLSPRFTVFASYVLPCTPSY